MKERFTRLFQRKKEQPRDFPSRLRQAGEVLYLPPTLFADNLIIDWEYQEPYAYLRKQAQVFANKLDGVDMPSDRHTAIEVFAREGVHLARRYEERVDTAHRERVAPYIVFLMTQVLAVTPIAGINRVGLNDRERLNRRFGYYYEAF